MELLRVILAALFVFVAMGTAFSYADSLPPWTMIIIMPLALGIAVVIFNKGALRRMRFKTDEDFADAELEAGRALTEHFNASRALSFEDLRTGCMVHFLELADGSVMCLYGQYLYEFEPIDDEPELNQPRRFPTSEFTIIRSRRDGQILDLRVGNDVIGTTLIEEPGDYDVIADLGFKLEDGEVVEGVTLDDVEAALAPNKA